MNEPPAPSLTTQRLRGLVQATLAYVEARGKLLQIEAQEASQHAGTIGKAAVIGLGALVGAWLLLMPAVVSLLSQWLARPWEHIALGLGLLHLIIAALALRLALTRWPQAKLFEESLNQLQKDREWIAGHTPPTQR